MMKYKLLLVDDEDMIRQGLRTRLEYFRFPNLDIVEAGSGAEALAMFRRWGNDIALAVVDICMPDMTGLELISEAKKICDRTRFVLLSGFAEFGYAQEGIRLGVRAYLNKPVSNDILRSQIESILWELSEEEVSLSGASERAAANPEKEFNMLLSGSHRDTAPAQAFPGLYARWPELFDGTARLYLSILHIEKKDAHGVLLTMDRLDAIRQAIRSIFMELKGERRILVANSYVNAQRLWVIYIGDSGGALKSEVEQMFLCVRQKLERRVNTSITMGVSGLADTLSYDCATQARAALRQRKLYGRSNIYFYEDISAFETQPFPEAELELLRKHMARGDQDGIREQLAKLFSEERLGARNVEYLNVLWVRVISLVLSTFDNVDIALTNRLLSQLTRADSFTDQHELVNALTGLIGACIHRDGQADVSVGDKVQYALEYMRERFNEDIVINDLAARLDMSPTYFSFIFKREVGMSALQYITGLRIEKAKEYLAQTDESVANIAQKTGYEGGQYFFRVFKKLTGMTPLMYRQQMRPTDSRDA